ncbi:hypothetical protein A3B84_02265 [Candidatus Nomurabacteria bacterium RIFCSPHIGHO2_02_FULL_35_13]|uniref:Uncharacterized protein n=2 Tax=Candidatus Nomuraibacteriota TaxID=1752729 RepID=A0A1F6VMM3_9BACT|nr:MAG: hypothetical protein UR88_C0006G0009 [Candidatus Nomurabacteria bacterium GW2011_GWA1_35_8]OGI70941.1 MAG: hypothetical protein A3B84_02265 [Candidatus Nomurabacteria bacterium RIFCSPHIGHO2_02_FULL_35_13]
MQKLNYPLNTYIKAVGILAKTKGFREVKIFNKNGSAVHFEVFLGTDTVPHSMWNVHSLHDKKRTIYSNEDYKKATRNLSCTVEEFLEILKRC